MLRRSQGSLSQEYLRFFNGATSNHNADNIKQNSMSGVSNTIIRWYNFGSKTHQHRECPGLDKGPKF